MSTLDTLSVSNTATEADPNALLLNYQLTTAPSGATVDGNGEITWTPGAGQQYTTNLFVTVVTDFDPLAINAQSLSATNSFNVVVLPPPWPVLPFQPDRLLSQLAPLTVSNKAVDGALAVNQIVTNTFLFNYANRNALLSDGWSFVGANGRNTEYTIGAGAVDYSQPGMLNIPCDQGDLYGTSYNNTRNSLFRSLPSNWLSVRLALTFAPINANYQQAHLGLYQDDDNYVQMGVAYNSWDTSGAERFTLDVETGGSPTTPAKAPTTSTIFYFRLDRDPVTSAITSYYSYDGVGWTVLGAVSSTLANPRLMIWTGGCDAAVPANFDLAVMSLRRLDIIAGASVPTVLSYSLINPPPGATIDSNGVITLTPSGNGINTLTTVVTDNGLPPQRATNSFNVVLSTVHSGPILPAQTNLVVAELTSLIVTNTALDTDLPTPLLTYSLVSPPSGLTISTNGIITWIPSEAQGPSTNTITTIVTDSSVPLSATNSFTVVVNEINSAPVLPTQADRTLLGQQTLLVTNTATDSDLPANSLTYQLVAPPAGAVIDTTGVITWTPQVPGTNVFTTVVTDSNPWAVNDQHLKATNRFTVVVNAIHNGPTLPAQPSMITIAEFTTLVVTNTAIDTDFPAQVLTYGLIEPVPEGAAIDNNGVITWTPTKAQGPSTNTFRTVVWDSGSRNDNNIITVIVTEINTAPSLPNQTNRVLVGQQTMTVTNTATDSDIPANTLTYQLAGPIGASIDTTGVIYWMPGSGQVPSTNLFTTVVTDYNPAAVNAQHLSATNSFTVAVVEPLSPPSIQSITINQGQIVISWNSTANHTYRLQYCDSLSSTNWQNVTPDVLASGPNVTTTNAIGSSASRFFRVLLMP
jgi:hypothetical protein